MGLPSAQLGSLPGISLPGNIQTTHKNPSIWTQALAGFIAGMAGDAGKAVIGNELSGENAQEFGKAPSTGWDRLLHGPAVDDKTAAQFRTEQGAMGRAGLAEKGANTRLQLSETGANTRNAADIASRESEGQKNRSFSGSESSLSRQQQEKLLGLEQTFQSGEHGKAFSHEDTMLASKLAAEAPKTAADVAELGSRSKLYEAQAKSSDTTNRILEDSLGGGKKQGGVNSNIAAFAGKAPPSSPASVPTATGPSETDLINAMLSKGMTPEQIQQTMLQGQARQAIVQNTVSARTSTEETAAALHEAAIREILKRIHPEDYPQYNSMFGQPLNPL